MKNSSYISSNKNKEREREKRDDDDFGGFFECDDGSGTRDRPNAGRFHSEKLSRRLRREQQFWFEERCL
jgi:hypothetical protein